MFNKNHEFKTSKQDKRGTVKRFIGVFLAFALVLGSISAVVIIKNNDISLENIFAGKTTANSGEDGSDSTIDDDELDEKLTGEANILLYCADEQMTEIYFMILVEADMDERSFTVYPVNTEGNGYISALSSGGCKGLVSAVESQEGVTVDRYISSNPDTFALAINYMEGLEYSVEKRIEYRNDDYTLILTEGDQTIKGETLLKYFRYCKTLGDDGLNQQGKLVCRMIENFITAENVENGMEIYQKVLEKLDTASDISYIEASKAMQPLRLLCSAEGEKFTVSVASDENTEKQGGRLNGKAD